MPTAIPITSWLRAFFALQECAMDGRGVMEIPDGDEGVIVQELDLAEAATRRAAFGFFRDRRPDLYGRLVSDE